MTAHIPPTEHKEIDFLDEIERELIALTTADLEGMREAATAAVDAVSAPATPVAPPFPALKTVIPAPAGTHDAPDVPTENDVSATPRGPGSRRSPG